MLTFTWLKWRFMVSDLLGILIYLYNIIALVLTYIRVVQKMTHLLISHNFLSGLCNLMKFHNRELQGDFSHYESFQLNVTKNMKVSNVQKKGV